MVTSITTNNITTTITIAITPTTPVTISAANYLSAMAQL